MGAASAVSAASTASTSSTATAGTPALAARRRGQRGETLLESLLAIAILSVVVAASFGGLQVALSASAQQRELAEAGAMLRNAAESLMDPESAYVDRAGCKGAGTYEDLPDRKDYGTVEARVDFVEPSVLSSARAAETAKSAAEPVCPAVDPGLQRITLSVRTPSGGVESMQIVKRRR